MRRLSLPIMAEMVSMPQFCIRGMAMDATTQDPSPLPQDPNEEIIAQDNDVEEVCVHGHLRTTVAVHCGWVGGSYA